MGILGCSQHFGCFVLIDFNHHTHHKPGELGCWESIHVTFIATWWISLHHISSAVQSHGPRATQNEPWSKMLLKSHLYLPSLAFRTFMQRKCQHKHYFSFSGFKNAKSTLISWSFDEHFMTKFVRKFVQNFHRDSGEENHYPAGAAAGYCFLLVSSFFFFFFFFFLLLLILPAQPQDLVSYSFLLSSSSSSFFFFLLATHLFHTLPYILFWPNLVTMTGTLTTTQAQKMVGSGVTMGSLGSKRSFAPKRHQVLQIT